MSHYKPLLRVDLDRGAVRTEARHRGESFFRCRCGFRLPSGPIRIHGDVAHVTGIGVENNIGEKTAPTSLTEWDKVWQKYCKLAFNLHRSDQIAEFKIDLQAGHVPQVAEPTLMTAALNLVTSMPVAGVRRWDGFQRRAPTTWQTTAWIRRRLAERRSEQDQAEHDRRWDSKVARALGEPRPGSSGVDQPHLPAAAEAQPRGNGAAAGMGDR